jgi:hypothetical protein
MLSSHFFIYSSAIAVSFVVIGLISAFLRARESGGSDPFYAVPVFISVLLGGLLPYLSRNGFIAMISITRTGTIEETGYMLKKK